MSILPSHTHTLLHGEPLYSFPGPPNPSLRTASSATCSVLRTALCFVAIPITNTSQHTPATVILCLPNEVISPQGEESQFVLYIVSCTETGYRRDSVTEQMTVWLVSFLSAVSTAALLPPHRTEHSDIFKGNIHFWTTGSTVPVPHPSPSQTPPSPTLSWIPLPLLRGTLGFLLGTACSCQCPAAPLFPSVAHSHSCPHLSARSVLPGPAGGTGRRAGTAVMGGLCVCHSHLPSFLLI